MMKISYAHVTKNIPWFEDGDPAKAEVRKYRVRQSCSSASSPGISVIISH